MGLLMFSCLKLEYLVLLTLLIFSSLFSYADDLVQDEPTLDMQVERVIITTRVTSKHIQNLMCKHAKCSMAKGSIIDNIDTRTEEFSNTNTMVRFQDDVFDKEVWVHLPSELSPDELMEVLIKVRTSKTLGAYRVNLATEAKNMGSVRVLNKQGQII